MKEAPTTPEKVLLCFTVCGFVSEENFRPQDTMHCVNLNHFTFEFLLLRSCGVKLFFQFACAKLQVVIVTRC